MAETIEEVRSRLDQMKSHFRSGFSSMEQEYLETIYLWIFRKSLPKRMGCQDCYRDAFIMIQNKLKSLTEMPVQSAYKLKAGVVASSFGSSDFYVLDMPEEAAEKWLHEFPDRINQFQKYPDDWQDRIAKRFAEPEIPAESEDEDLPHEIEETPENAQDSAIEGVTDTFIVSTIEKPKRGRRKANSKL